MYSIDQQQRILRETDIVNAQRRRHRGGVIVNASKRTTKTKPQWDFIAIAKQRAARTGETLSESMRYIAKHESARHRDWLERQRAAVVASKQRTSDKSNSGGSLGELARQYATEHDCSIAESWRWIAATYEKTHAAWVREGCE